MQAGASSRWARVAFGGGRGGGACIVQPRVHADGGLWLPTTVHPLPCRFSAIEWHQTAGICNGGAAQHFLAALQCRASRMKHAARPNSTPQPNPSSRQPNVDFQDGGRQAPAQVLLDVAPFCCPALQFFGIVHAIHCLFTRPLPCPLPLLMHQDPAGCAL